MDLRCPARKHAELDGGYIEIRCRSKFCGYQTGIVVIHRFDPLTGELLQTKRFRDPGPNGEGGKSHGSVNNPAALRSA